MREEAYLIKGMSCVSCARSIENSLRELPQVAEASVDFNQSKLVLSFREEGLSFESVRSEIQKLGGYDLRPYEEQNVVPSQRDYSPLFWGILGAVGISIIFYLVQALGMLDLKAPLEFTRDKWYFVFPLILGFGIQMGLFRAIHLKTKQGIATPAASGGVTTTAMIACCMHNLVTLFPFLGLSGLAVFFGVYQDYIFGLSLVFVAGGILFMGWKYNRVHACCKK